MKPTLQYLFLIVLLSCGCYENIDNTPPEPEVIIETSEVYVTTRVSGSAIDLEEQVLNDYYLSINGSNQDVPADYFLVELEDARKKGQTIRVNKDGNQIGIKTELLVENDINHIVITTHGAFKNDVKSKSQANIQFRKELSVSFAETDFTSGYQGDLNIDYINIDPIINLTPVGYDYESHLLAVDSKGGFYIKVKDNSGNNLEIDPSSNVKLTIGDIEEDVNGLFSLNEKTDIWELITEITANSEVEIKARGYYTFAKFTKGVFIEGAVSKDEQKVAYQPMKWDHVGLQNDMCTTEKGRYIGLLPEKEVVTIELLNPCDESLQSESIQINNDDLSNQNLNITNTENYQYLNTTVIDCDGNTITNASINITSNNNDNHYVFSEEGQNRWIPVCGEFTIAAYDESMQEQGTQIEWSSALNETIDILSGCAEYTNGFSYLKIREEEEIYSAFDLEVIGDRTILSATNDEVKIIFKGTDVGQYPENQINIVINDDEFGDSGYYIQCENSELGCGIKNFNVTHYNTQENGQVRIEFSGNVWMQTLNPTQAGTYPVEGVIVSKS